MGFATRSDDWEVAGLAGIGLVPGVGADITFWMFRCQAADVEEPFVSIAIAGGGSAGAGMVSVATPLEQILAQMRGRQHSGSLSYTRINVLNDFSLWDLHGSLFTVVQGAASGTVGYLNTWIAAVTWSRGHLFRRQECHGAIAGVHVSAIAGVGTLQALRFFGAADGRRASLSGDAGLQGSGFARADGPVRRRRQLGLG